ncbi:MAG: DUF2975 domain-containing protein [Lewinellaceae bacterium]|nr:DUF2975 domain-containing protein [Saprospiraceae bacterium]MCB9332555.1 DUF2975 domain-containing protein [Lewinellaceae bacterium]
MKKPFNLSLLGLLRYLFMLLVLSGTILFLLNLQGIFNGEHICIRGWVTMIRPWNAIEIPGAGHVQALKMFNFGQQKQFIMLEFSRFAEVLSFPYLAFLIFDCLSWLTSLLILYQMMLFFKNLESGAPFQTSTIHKVRLIAFLVFTFPILRFLTSWILTNIVRKVQGASDLVIGTTVNLEEMLIGAISAIIIYALLEIFQRGQTLQQEQDLTI